MYLMSDLNISHPKVWKKSANIVKNGIQSEIPKYIEEEVSKRLRVF
jgi:hypothetical protein